MLWRFFRNPKSWIAEFHGLFEELMVSPLQPIGRKCSYILIYAFSHNHGSGKGLFLKGNYYCRGPILHFHDYGRKGTIY